MKKIVPSWLVTLVVIVLLMVVSQACNSSSPEMPDQPEEVITPMTFESPTNEDVDSISTQFSDPASTSVPVEPTSVPAPAADVTQCSASFNQLETELVTQGKAVASDYVWDQSAGNFTTIDPSITAEGCSVLKSSMGTLINAGCDLDSATQAAEADSNRTDSDYRSCKRRYPDDWDKKCQLQFSIDQQVGGNHIKLMEITNWLNICK
jgi:hypothetical protein